VDPGQNNDIAVVGAGILGLATARALLLERPSLRVVVLEKEAAPAIHQTGHNSGVVHSGIYYRPGSLKATLCIRGKQALERYADEHAIPLQPLGKLIVASDPSELERLEELRLRAVANGVAGLREIEGGAIAEIEPHAVGVRALHASATGVIDYRAVTSAFADDVRAGGGEVLFGRAVEAIDVSSRGVALTTSGGEVEARYLVTCAGLQSDRIARLAGADPRARIVPFRGDYYTLAASAGALVRGLIYPVPDPAFPFLGVHFTRKIDGSVVAGPNAVLALARERYRRVAVDLRDAADALGYPGVWRFAARHPRTGAGELWRDLSKRAFVHDMQRYVPSIGRTDVTFGPTGIRAQALTRDGTLVDDFVIASSPRAMHVVNAPSPAATASLAIGEEIAGRVLRDLLD
jgi:(S)-2-hydroxyglutarate dehydrogenase